MNDQRRQQLEILYEKCHIGEEIYNTIKKSLPEKQEVIVSPGHLGDLVWLAMLADTYKKYHGIDKLIFVIRDGMEEIANMYAAIDGITALPENMMDALNTYMLIKKFYYANGIRYGHWPSDMYEIEVPGDSFEHAYEIILDIPLNSKKVVMNIPVIDQSASDSLLHKTVLLAPGIFSLVGQPATFWNKIAAALREKGYEVYNNWGGKSYDIEIDSVEKLELSLKELVQIAGSFKLIIAARSGICDLLANTTARLMTIYPEKGEDKKIFYSLNALSLEDNLFSMVYDPEQEDGLIDEIMELLL